VIGKAQVPVRKSVKLIGYLCIENAKNIQHIANNKQILYVQETAIIKTYFIALFNNVAIYMKVQYL